MSLTGNFALQTLKAAPTVTTLKILGCILYYETLMTLGFRGLNMKYLQQAPVVCSWYLAVDNIWEGSGSLRRWDPVK